jgi:class 3 adenylate cyclase/predicted nucleic acid-binding Zn ribbon protein
LNTEKKVLNERVRTLNEEQLKAELVIALQNNRVDSLKFLSALDSITLVQNQMALEEQTAKNKLQESELQLQQTQRNLFLMMMGVFALLALGVFFRYKETKKMNEMLEFKNELIEKEREKSEELLLNILPSAVADELKLHGFAKARKYKTATVLFSDFVNFSGISKSMTAEDLVSLLDYYFKMFDEIITKYKLEKIKTIGDAYMCVGGLPEEHNHHAVDVVRAAMDIKDLLEKKKEENMKSGAPFFEARIGIHTGPLVSGVVGTKKFAFDVWGDTVNVASRMESGGEAGKINISDATYKLVSSKFKCLPRGKVPIKNRGEVEMYFVENAVG